MRWPRLFGQFFRFDEWSLCQNAPREPVSERMAATCKLILHRDRHAPRGDADRRCVQKRDMRLRGGGLYARRPVVESLCQDGGREKGILRPVFSCLHDPERHSGPALVLAADGRQFPEVSFVDSRSKRPVFAKGGWIVKRSRNTNRRRRPVMLAVAATLAVCVVGYPLMAYVVLPALWTHYEHQPGLRDRPMTTVTGQGIPGDPLNVGLVGSNAEIVKALRLAGWYPADAITLRTSVEIAESVLLHRSYLDAPVSNLFYDGRQQDIAFEKPVGGSADARHHVRLWMIQGIPAPGSLARLDDLRPGSRNQSLYGSDHTPLRTRYRCGAGFLCRRAVPCGGAHSGLPSLRHRAHHQRTQRWRRPVLHRW